MLMVRGSNINNLNVYWWRPRSKPYNFGDELGALILKKIGYKVKRVALAKADLITTGTIIDMAEVKNPSCTIWGSGVGWLHNVDAQFKVLALRGKISGQSLGVEVPYGDPGLLVSRFYPKQPPKYNVGVVRHFIDKNDYDWADIVIDATEDPETVINKISSCRTICSSSLHGLIVAYSYGIPAMRIHMDSVISGDWKWLDFQTALDKPIVQIQDELLEALWSL